MLTEELDKIKARLEYLRGEIEAERISYGEISELQDLVEHIDPDDVLLLQWAGRPEPTGPSENTITITVDGGCVVDVEGLPDGFDYVVDDRDV